MLHFLICAATKGDKSKANCVKIAAKSARYVIVTLMENCGLVVFVEYSYIERMCPIVVFVLVIVERNTVLSSIKS